RLSAKDHFNSSGQRLTSAAAIIRQDRANFHRNDIRDEEDQADLFFADEDNRKVLEAMLERGSNSASALSTIVNGTPLIRVSIYKGGQGDFVRVEIFGGPSGSSGRDPS